MTNLAALAALHARLLLEAREAEAIARRNPDHADRERAEADTRRAEADALAALLEPQGALVAPPGQLSLFSDGGPK